MPTFQETESSEMIAEARSLLAMNNGSKQRSTVVVRESKGGSRRSLLVNEQAAYDAKLPQVSYSLPGSSIYQQSKKKKQELSATWKKVRDKKIGNEATMGDWVATNEFMHFPDPYPSFSEMVGSYIGIDPDKVVTVQKTYPSLMTNVLRYTITKLFKGGRQGSYGFEEMTVVMDGIELSVDSGMNRMMAIETGLDQITQVPIEPTLGVVGGQRKLCLILRSSYDQDVLTIYGASEEDTNDFLGWLGQQIKQHNYLKKAKIDGKGGFLKLGEQTWNDIVLKKGIREKIESNIMDLFRKEEVYLTNGIPPKRGFALVGPPGTGKTLLAKIMAWALKDVTFIWITPSSIYGAGSIGNLYELAQELAPSIVFFEDADVYLGQRGTIEASGGILTELMNRLDGISPIRGVVTGISSNRPEVLESALIRRPGRFDMVIELGPPDEEGRLKLLRKHFSQTRVEPGAVEKLSDDERTHGMEPCKLEEIARRAILQAIEKGDYDKKSLLANVTWQHIQDGLAEYLQEQDFKSSYMRAEHRLETPIDFIAEALDAAGLMPLHEQTRNAEDKIRDFAKLISPDGLDERDLFERPIADNDDVLNTWDELLDNVQMLRRFGIRRSSVRAAKKIYDNEDITGEDVIRMLTGED